MWIQGKLLQLVVDSGRGEQLKKLSVTKNDSNKYCILSDKILSPQLHRNKSFEE